MSVKIKYPIGGYAPGNYMNTCTQCKDEFTGDKRAVQCEPCAINALIQSHQNAIKRIQELETNEKKIPKLKYKIGDAVYLLTDSEQKERLITGINLRPGSFYYVLSCGEDVSSNYEFEISDSKMVI